MSPSPARRARFTALRRLAVTAIAAATVATSLVSCSSEPDTLRVLAGSEVKDMAPVLEEMADKIGVQLEFEYMGTLDGTEALLGGDRGKWDATWFPSNRYLSLFPEGASVIAKSESIMRSPIVLGLKPEAATALGWGGTTQPSWADVVAAVREGRLSYGMTSPISSNSGFTTLVQMTTALSGTGAVLGTSDIAATQADLVDFAAGQTLASGSSGWLAEKFAEQPDAADGIFNYESVLQGMSVGGQPLTTVIPSDGVITSDYPLSLLAGADSATSERFDKVVEYLLSAPVQQQIADQTHRRTTATPPSMSATVFELPFPNQLDTVQTLLQTWVANVKKPSNMVFAIDTSGSMRAEGLMDDLRSALAVLSGQQPDGSASFLRLQPRETITYLEFAGSVKSTKRVEIPSDSAGYQAALDDINTSIQRYSPSGGTNIYGTLEEAYDQALSGAGEGSLSSIVLFTDGENTAGPSESEFESWYRSFVATNPQAASIPVFVILFGEGSPDELTGIATLTGGRLFDAESGSLESVFREIRGYL